PPSLQPKLLGMGQGCVVATSETRIDGRALSVSNLREAESRAFTCLAAAPNLTWYLNGQRQETNAAGRPLAAAGAASGEDGSGTFVVTARRVDRRLDCAATDPATGRVSTASVLLNVQCERSTCPNSRVQLSAPPGSLSCTWLVGNRDIRPLELPWQNSFEATSQALGQLSCRVTLGQGKPASRGAACLAGGGQVSRE
uniref:Ig-like domain-containing protein n=1 Tax=Naja naja TaxID=35670 RepID=A0A8C7E3A6_NAJNA